MSFSVFTFMLSSREDIVNFAACLPACLVSRLSNRDFADNLKYKFTAFYNQPVSTTITSDSFKSYMRVSEKLILFGRKASFKLLPLGLEWRLRTIFGCLGAIINHLMNIQQPFIYMHLNHLANSSLNCTELLIASDFSNQCYSWCAIFLHHSCVAALQALRCVLRRTQARPS